MGDVEGSEVGAVAPAAEEEVVVDGSGQGFDCTQRGFGEVVELGGERVIC